ncbi:helix-turn-helix domain-containing protein, partial [Eubacterium sp.]
MEQEKIGKFIAENRKAKGLTQIEFAEKLGVSNKSVSRWETGKNMPDVSLFLPLCELLGISVNKLIIGERISTEESKKADEIIVETIKTSNKKLRTLHILLYVVVVLVNAVFTIVVPITATPSDAMAVPLMAIIGGALSALLLSFLNIKPVWKFIFIPIS